MNTVSDSPPVQRVRRRPRVGFAWQIVIGLVVGIVVGAALNAYPQYREAVVTGFLQPAGDIFIKLIKMIIVPLVFTSMVVGISGVGDSKSFGRVGLKTLVYFEVITTIAILFGLVAGNVLHPGVGADMSKLGHVDASRLAGMSQQAHGHHGFMQLILDFIPDNVFSSMAKGDLLPVIFFSVVFGLALQSVSDEFRKPVIATLKGIADAMYKVTGMVMRYAPVGVCALIAVTVASFGVGSLLPLLKLIAVTYFVIVLFVLVVLGLTARLFGFRILTLLRIIKNEILIAFTTCSSATVLPQVMKKVEDYGVPKGIAAFVVPTGYTFNLDGTAIYLGIGALFIAQLYGIHLGLQQQIVLVLTMVITSKGAAAVPGMMFITMLATLSSAGLPLEGLLLIAGVDRFMDMARSALNVIGNTVAPLVIARWEGQYDQAKGDAFVAALDE